MEKFGPYIWPFIGAVVVSILATAFVRNLVMKYQLTPVIRPRDSHKVPTPRLGGVGIVVGFWLVVLMVMIGAPDRLMFVREKVGGIDRNLLGVGLGAIVIIGAMLYDDLKNLPWVGKLLAQLTAAILVAGFGVTIPWLSNPFGAQIMLNKTIFTLGALAPTWGQLFVVLWIVLVMNIINWLDGLDGLVGGISIIAGGTLVLLALRGVSQGATAMLGVILVGSILGFLPYNLHPAKIFLGDTGSMFIGYMLAILAIISGGKVATAGLVLGVPILDGIFVVVNRLWHHRSPFHADKNHLHHRLIKAGLSVGQTVVVFYIISVIFGFVALKSGTMGKFIAGLWLVGLMAGLAVILVILEWQKKIKEPLKKV